jgi:hypothetical protein
MTIIYIHGVKVRDKAHGIALGKPFLRWLGPKLAVGGGAVGYAPVYWGDAAADFRWRLESRPKTPLLGMGGADSTPRPFQGLGSLREAAARTPLDKTAAPASVDTGPVLGGSSAVASPAAAPPLASIARDKRPDFLADLYLAVRAQSRADSGAQPARDPIAEEGRLAGLAAAAATVAADWDRLIAAESTDDARAARLVTAVEAELHGDTMLPMGGFADWAARAGETLRRAAFWPGDAVSTVFSELRPVVNEFVAYFIGDVLSYLNERGADPPGVVPRRVLDALVGAHGRKQQTGEKIVVITHSMGGQLLYDALTFFARGEPALSGLEIDHWISCGAQVSLFAELGLFEGQPTDVRAPHRLPRPAAVKAWTNFYDLNDLVGFVMGPVFEGVTDTEYDTGYGLAFAHTGYLARPSFFEKIAARL